MFLVNDPANRTEFISYKCSENIKYIVEPSSIRIVDVTRGHTLVVDYPQAAIWDFLCRGYSRSKIKKLLVIIADVTQDHAESLIDDFLCMLIREKFLEQDNG